MSATPQRVTMQRRKRWRMPPNTVYVGRPTMWGNPVKAGGPITAEAAVAAYKLHIKQKLRDEPIYRYMMLYKLRGRNLACWCKPGKPCHADVLLKLANETKP